MNKKILAVAAAATVAAGLGTAAVFADDIDREVSLMSEAVEQDVAQNGGSEAEAFVRYGYGYGYRGYGYGYRGYGYRPVGYYGGYGYRRAWAPGYWGWGGYRRGYWVY